VTVYRDAWCDLRAHAFLTGHPHVSPKKHADLGAAFGSTIEIWRGNTGSDHVRVRPSIIAGPDLT